MKTASWKLVAVETHPIQYKAPLFRLMAEDPRFDLTVFYAMIPDSSQQGDGFGVAFQWDVPLLEGYHYELLNNVARKPSVSQFNGCVTPEIYQRIKEMRPDAVLVNGWVAKTCIQTLIACRWLRIPCIVRGEANLLRPRGWWKHAVHRLLLPNYSAYLAIGSASRAFYRAHRRPEENIFPAPYAIDNEFFAKQVESRISHRDAWRDQWGISHEACTFLFVGKLEQKKHPMDLLNALAALPEDLRCRAHVLVAGDGPLMSACRAYADENGLPVYFAGFVNQSQLPDVYAASDVLVLPSDAGETWGLVVNEAMASGRPAVVSRSVGCCRDLIVEGQTGFSFDVDDIELLATHMKTYIEAPELAHQQGLAASRHIQSFGFSQVIEGIARAVDFCSKKQLLRK